MHLLNRTEGLGLINSVKLKIWSREFTLPIDYDCLEGETPTQDQVNALDGFLAHPEWVDKAKSQVEKYCKKALLEDEENQKKDNVFSYVIPESVFVKCGERHPRVALLCKYRYDLEHGLAMVFQTDGKLQVGTQDIIL